jgi:hypothetical protein
VKRECLFATIMILAAPGIMAAADKFPEPTGIGKAKFGMSVGEVRKLYPKLQPTKGTEEALKKGEQLVVIYEMDNQSVGPLKPCHTELRFFKDELYEVQIHCPDRDKVVAYLQKTYGPSTKASEKSIFWKGEHSAVTLAPRSGAFAFDDLKRSQAMQAALLAALSSMQRQTSGQSVPAAAPTPAETPAAPAQP